MKSLKGKFFIRRDMEDDNRITIGSVIDANDTHLLIKHDLVPNCPQKVVGANLFSVDDVSELFEDGFPIWSFFDSLEERTEYINFMRRQFEEDNDDDDDDKIISISDKKGH